MGARPGKKAEPEGDVEKQEGPVLGRKGVCRICFDGGGELIQPCACKGSSKWIHRSCLDRWRTMGSNPRSMTNCCECGFQYHLKLHRVMASDAEERQRSFRRMLAAQGLGCFVGTQLIIIALGLIIRGIDKHEWLVDLFGFPQDEGQDVAGDYWNALEHHKLTYYVAGLICLLALIGLGAIVAAITACCASSSRPGRNACGDVTLDCCCPRNALDCYLCSDCCTDCSRDCGTCPRPQFNLGSGTNHNETVGLLAIVVIVLAVVGLFAAVFAMVTAVQRALQNYAQMQQKWVLSQEYIVLDLADPHDLGDATEDTSQHMKHEQTAPPVVDSAEQQKLQSSISLDLADVYGEGPSSRRLDTAYGAA